MESLREDKKRRGERRGGKVEEVKGEERAHLRGTPTFMLISASVHSSGEMHPDPSLSKVRKAVRTAKKV